MNKNTIAIKKLRKVFTPKDVAPKGSSVAGKSMVMTLQANVINLGFIMSTDLIDELSEIEVNAFESFSKEFVDILRKLKGADVDYNPMYPNFPKQVMEASDAELWMNAILHYWTYGQWKPNYDKIPREYAPENIKLVEIDLATSEDEFANVFTQLLGSNESISDTDVKIVKWFLKNYTNLVYPEKIPFKENMALVGAYMVENGYDISDLVKNATDVLRIATEMSGGDVSLSDNTRYKSFKRSQRRNIVNVLAGVIREEDIARHAGKWVRLAHSLHVGDYSDKVYNILKKVRENEKIITFNSKVEEFLKNGQPVKATKLLMERPGDFARRLDHILRLAKTPSNQMKVTKAFTSVCSEVSTNVLLQVMGHFQKRHEAMDKRVVFPKGSVQKAQIIDGLKPLDEKVVKAVYQGCRNALIERFAELPELGKVYVDPSMDTCPIPTQQRSTNEAFETVARGTRIPIDDDEKNTLRFFIYWVGRDIDLSMTMYDENFNDAGYVSYTRLRDFSAGVYHSGDITRAPNGESEFIDVDINKALGNNVRFIAMNVYVFSGPTFAEHEKCYAGWMTRKNPDSNEVYEPSTVENKIDMTNETRTAVPVIFDLLNREAIWTDLAARPRNPVNDGWYRGNNVENNRARIKDIVEAITTNNNKVSLYELFNIHGEARGTIVDSPEDADVVYSWNGDITPKNTNVIHSEYVL